MTRRFFQKVDDYLDRFDGSLLCRASWAITFMVIGSLATLTIQRLHSGPQAIEHVSGLRAAERTPAVYGPLPSIDEQHQIVDDYQRRLRFTNEQQN